VDVIVDKETESIIIADFGNQRVVRWPRRGGKREETLVSDVVSYGLTMDEQGSLYIPDEDDVELDVKDEDENEDEDKVRRYQRGDTQGKVVAGGNGQGNRLNQLSSPRHVFVDREHSVYVSDYLNGRVMKWKEGATQGIVVASQLSCPQGVVVDQLETVYVVEQGNHRIMRWLNGAKQGIVVTGVNGSGNTPNQLSYPCGLSFDRDGNLYVADQSNHRVQRFDLQ
jgi:sugar lactone lactonase YvrE